MLKAARSEKQIDALLVTAPKDIRYLSGLHEGSGSLLIGDGWALLLTRRMFLAVARQQCPGMQIEVCDDDTRRIAEEVATRDLKKIGLEESMVHVPRHRTLRRKLGRKLVALPAIVLEYRAVKDDEEIRITRKAVRIAEKAFRQLIEPGADGLVGQTEKQLAADLEYRMRCLGADRQGFGTNGIIVGSGPNSASCHHLPTTRRIKRHEPLLFDWGAEIDGYRSDITRVVFPGRPSDRMAEIYTVVEKALKTSTRKVRPGAVTGHVFQAAFDVIEEAGYGDHFPHGLGHGLGLVIHEQPRLNRNNKVRLKKNMIITVEPGIYLDGKGGVRLENDLLLVAGGHKVLGSLPTSLKRAILS